MNGISVIFFVMALVFLCFALADQRWLHEKQRGRLRYLGRESYEPSSGALVFQRVLFLALAAGTVFSGLYVRHLDHEARHPDLWTSTELREAVTSAAPRLGIATVMYDEDMSPDHSTDVETAVDSAVSGDAPSSHVHVSQVGESADQQYEITADGAGATFCMSVYRTDPSDTPGIGGGTSHVKQYTLKGRVKSGTC